MKFIKHNMLDRLRAAVIGANDGLCQQPIWIVWCCCCRRNNRDHSYDRCSRICGGAILMAGLGVCISEFFKLILKADIEPWRVELALLRYMEYEGIDSPFSATGG